MKRYYTLLLCTLIALLIPAMQAWSNLSEYGFQPTTGEYIDIGGGTRIHGPGADDDQSKPLDIGFTFYFDGVPYNQFSCSSDGLIGLGSNPSTACWGNDLTAPDGACSDVNGAYKGYDYTLFQTPHIAPFWDDLRVPSSAEGEPDGSISYALIGKAPNRILVIDFNTVETFYQFGSFSSWQCRLYERTNKIEFYYDYMNPDYYPSFRSGDAGTIGLAASSKNFLSVSSNYDGEIGQFSYSAQAEKPDNFFSLNDPDERGNPSLPGGTMFVFTPCQLMIDGNTDQGASAAEMSDGSPIFTKTEVMRGTTGYFQPIGIWLAGGCLDRTYVAEITGPSASEYFISPEKMTITAGDKPFFPDVQFTPAGLGVRKALLTITDDHGVVQSFPLQATGTPRIIWSGDPAQGGVPDMKDSSTLLKGMHVKRGETGTYMPFTLTNIMEGEGQEGGAAIIYTIKGTSKGQYTIDPTETSLNGGQSSTPTITFTPTGVGVIRDTLVVDADGEIRTFPLAGFSDASGGEFFANFTKIDSNSQFFNNQFSCSGDGAITIPINTVNIGTGPFLITGFQAFDVDTTIGQGTPRYKNLRDANGKLIPMADYILTEQPPVTPASANQVTFPISVPQGESKTLYLTFIGQRPGKRYARAYIQTNGEAAFAQNPDGEMVEGLFTFNLFGRGTGARLSDQKNGGLPGSLIFPSTLIGKSSEKRMALFNTGQCPLRISMDNLRISTGDVEEFAIIELPGGAKVDKATNDIYIAPGDSASVLIRFTPQANGSRRSTIKLRTNDSTIQIPGITEAGTYYVDLFGESPADLAPSAPDFGVALIGGGPAEQKKGMVNLANATNIPVTITAITLNGTDAADFITNPALPWATLPITVAPGSSVDLNMIFAPMTGTPGPRTTKVVVTLANGSQVIAQLNGEAGTRTVEIGPANLSFGTVKAGRTARQTVVIHNSGTMPLQLRTPVLSGANATEFSFGSLPRMELAPGQTEYLEVAFTPAGQVSSTASLTIPSNGTNGPSIITINGTGTKTLRVDDNPTQTIGGDRHGEIVRGGDNASVAGTDGSVTIGGIALRQSIPNPARDLVEISYNLNDRSSVSLALYDGNGRLVKTIDAGMRDAGERKVMVDVRDLASGVYHYRLMVAGHVLDRSLTIVR